MISPTNLTQKIKQKAHEIGFHHVGVTTPETPGHFDVYQQWISDGYHADMAWMASDKALQRRDNPRRILPECKSILCLGIHYTPAPSPLIKQTETDGKIAAYAWGKDYHNILPERLKAIVSFIKAQVGQLKIH